MSKVPVRWLMSRLKRTVVLVTLLVSVAVVSCVIFLFLNSQPFSTHWNQHMGPGYDKSSKSGTAAGGQRPMVQFYPDNQVKANFRAVQGEADDLARLGRDDDEDWRAGKAEDADDSGDDDGEAWEEKLKRKLIPNPDSKRYPGNSNVLSYDVHLFYYAWYGSPEFNDGKYYHWNHKYLENWNKQDKRSYPSGIHDPDNDDVGANFYPELGAYSSADPTVLAEHMKQMKLSGAGVVAVSWYPPGLSDENGPPSDGMIKPILDAAEKEDLKVTLHIEPYAGMTPENLRKHLQYVKDTYLSHPAFYKKRVGRRDLPLYYIYDSYRVLPEQWTRLLSSKGDLTVRGTDLDALFIGLLVDFKHRAAIKKAKFDGFYTYFAANGFTHGSSWKNWRSLQDYAMRNSLLFIPSLGPGYVDTRIRPWNGQNTRDRRKGSYYDMAWRSALNFKPKMVSITSFNEWHEGTQIETAVPKDTKNGSYSYLSYAPAKPEYYLLQTRSWVRKFVNDE